MNELALFAGAGGGILGTRLLGWRVVCAVEKDPYCQEILMRRQEEGHLEPFPIWDDVRSFQGEPWREVVDIVTFGDPCPYASTAAHGANTAKPMWREALRIIGECKPTYVLRENVVGSIKDMPALFTELRGIGYEPHEPLVASAAAVGAGHVRSRCWVFAHAHGSGEHMRPFDAKASRMSPLYRDIRAWETNPGDLRVDDGVAHRVDRLRAAGNGQVPAVVREAWELLTR